MCFSIFPPEIKLWTNNVQRFDNTKINNTENSHLMKLFSEAKTTKIKGQIISQSVDVLNQSFSITLIFVFLF